MRSRTLLLLASIIAAVLVGGWWFYEKTPVIAAVAVTRGDAAEIVYATGSVEPVRWAKVASLVRDRIVSICDCEGRKIAKGDELARLDDSEVQAQLIDLRAREDFLKREMTRVTELIARGAATTQSFERASMDLQQVQAQIRVQIARISDYKISAPMDGMVLRRDGEIGEIAEAGQIIFRVGVLRPLQVVAEVNEEDIPRVTVGRLVLFRTDAYPGQRLEGRVNEITPMGDVTAKTFRIKISLPDDTVLFPGMSVEANIIARQKSDVLLVPTDAIQGNSVFVVEGSHVRRIAITPGIRGARMSEVVAGIEEGQRVASPAPAALTDGARVRTAAAR